MADQPGKTPDIDEKAGPPETHKQTEPLERKISPQHNTTEDYGTSSEEARRSS